MDNVDALAIMKDRKLKLLEQNNEERKMKLEKRKEIKSNQIVAEESINNIVSNFESLEADILSCLKQIEDVNTPKESLNELFDSCYCKLEEWQKMISLTSHILTIYHRKSFQEKYRNMDDRKLKLEQSLIPEKKFSFKRVQKKKTEEGCEKPPEDVLDAVVQKPSRKYFFNPEDEFGIANKVNENLTLNYDELAQKDVVFRELKGCKLNIEGGATTIHFVSLSDCHVLCGPVATSVFVESCHKCTFVVACQQLRTHNTYDTDFYVHVTSRAIIEDCQGVRFAPYNWKYESIEEHFKLVNLNSQENNWNLVNDFNWLCSSPSPNWSIIAEENRVTN